MAPPILPLICGYTEKPAARALVDELSARTVKAITGRELAEQDAQRLAHNLWVSVYAKDLSERQIETLQNDMQAHLVSLGWARTVPSR